MHGDCCSANLVLGSEGEAAETQAVSSRADAALLTLLL